MRPKYSPRILSAFILAFILSFVNFLSIYGDPIKKTIISGTVINLDESTDPLQIQLITFKPFILKAIFEPAYLDEEGRFNFEFEQLYPFEVTILYKEVFVVYAFPGDSITITRDADFLKADQTNNFYHHEYYENNCSRKIFQSEYLKFHRAYYSSHEIVASSS